MKQKLSRGVNVTVRRLSVIDRLTEQLKVGTKAQKVDNADQLVPLTEKDTVRIKRELETLKTRVL